MRYFQRKRNEPVAKMMEVPINLEHVQGCPTHERWEEELKFRGKQIDYMHKAINEAEITIARLKVHIAKLERTLVETAKSSDRGVKKMAGRKHGARISA